MTDSMRPLPDESVSSEVPTADDVDLSAARDIGLQTRVSRRTFLKALGAAAGIALVSPATAQSEEGHHEDSEHDEHHELHTAPEWLDILAASGVLAAFGYHVLYNGAVKGKPLGPHSAKAVGGAAVLRDIVLYIFGGEGGKVQAAHEIAHLAKDAVPIPVLVGLSDFTTTELKVDADEIFSNVRGAVNDRMDYTNIQRPDLGMDVADWEKHLEKVETDLSTKVAQISAITSVLAPMGTTYTSSSLSNDLKADVMRILYEQAFSRRVIQIKKEQGSDAIIHADEVQQAAANDADTMMNGRFGFSKLMFALAANTQGSWGLGDPPEIYFAMNHADDLATLAAGHGLGAVNSEFYTLLLNAIWLKKAGILEPGAALDLFKFQWQTTKSIAGSLLNSDLRSVSFGNGKKQAAEVIEALNDKTDPEGKLRRALQAIPAARLQFGGYLAHKRRQTEELLNGRLGNLDLSNILEVIDHDYSGIEHLTTEDLAEVVAKFTKGKNVNETKVLLLLEKVAQTSGAQKIASLLEAAANNNEEYSEDDDTEVLSDPAKVTEYSQIFTRLNEMVNDTKHPDRIGEALAEMKTSDDERYQRIATILSSYDEGTIQEAVRFLTRIEKGEDAIPGHETVDAGAEVSEAMSHAHEEHGFLSESAHEVLWALSTQIPSVPGLARFAEIMILKLAGVKAGEAPTLEQLNKIIFTMLPIEAGMSAVADNVAAYLFAEKTLLNFFKSTYGEDIFERFPKAQRIIAVTTKLLAEQAGSLTQVGNGPNFSQERCTVVMDSSNSQGISIDRSAITMPETLPQQNAFSTTANVTLVAGAIIVLQNLAKEVNDFVGGPTTPGGHASDINGRINAAA